MLNISGMIKECRNDQSNCLTESYAECLWKSVAFNNKTEYVNVCVCKAGYVMRENDICDTGNENRYKNQDFDL